MRPADTLAPPPPPPSPPSSDVATATAPARVRAPRRPARPWLAAVAALAAAMAIRLPSSSLPIAGEPVAHAALARALADGEGYAAPGVASAGVPPLYPALVAIPVALGAPASHAIRWTGIVLGGLGAALFVLLAARWPGAKASGWAAAGLVAVHPALVAWAGGLSAGPEALGLALALASVRLSFASGRRVRTAGLALAGLLPLCRYDLVPFAVAAFALAWARSRGATRPRRAIGIAATLAFLPLLAWLGRNALVAGSVFGPADGAHGLSLARLPGDTLVLAALVLPVAGLGLLLRWAPAGLAAVAATRGPDRAPLRAAWIAVGSHLLLVVLFAGLSRGADGAFAFTADALRAGACAVPFVLLAVLCGLAAAGGRGRGRRRLVAATVAVAAAASVLIGSGPIQRRLVVSGPYEAGRLDVFAEAVRAAGEAAGPTGSVAFDLRPSADLGIEAFAGDLVPGRAVGALAAGRAPRGASGAPRLETWGLPGGGGLVLVRDRDL